jgi:tetraacyldisaccharide 4'-kinase
VVANPDRVAGVRAALAAGAQLAVLDDAFQHRRVRRDVDIILLSAEQLARPRHVLPAGPWREPLSVARAADLIVITRKSVPAADAADVARRALGGIDLPVAQVHIAPRRLERAGGGEGRDLAALRGATVLAVAAVGEPDLFARQLEAQGARVTLRAFRDHHRYTADEAAALAAAAPDDALAVCTLKDAVKLAPLWPASRTLWYVSQQLVVEEGAEHLDRLCARVLARVTAVAG